MPPKESEVISGKIYFEPEGFPYATFQSTCKLTEILKVMTQEWKLKIPKILLRIISDNEPLKQWESPIERDNFLKGLIKGSNATSMWIFTNGLNLGISKLIGDEFQKNYKERTSQFCFRHEKEKINVSKAPVIGLCSENVLTYQDQFKQPEKAIRLYNTGNIPEEQKYDINPNLSHLLVVHSKQHQDAMRTFLQRFEHILLHPVHSDENSVFPTSPVPIIAILIQGNSKTLNYILDHIGKGLPVLVIGGSGGLADLLAYAYYETRRSGQKVRDKEFVDTILRKLILEKIISVFPYLKDNKLSQNTLCAKLLKCIEDSKPPEMKQLTVLNVLDFKCNMENLPYYLLKALFKLAETAEELNVLDQLRKDLQLVLDWNCPEFALTKVFYSYPTFKVENDMFEQALLQKEREEFVHIFLSNGFEVHKYLNANKLVKLYEKSLKDAFFRETCWEGILGYRKIVTLDKSFIDEDLNWMINHLIGISTFVTSKELDNACKERFDNTQPKDISIEIAKRKAVMVLVMWALLSKRDKLVMVLWQHTDFPIMTALSAALILHKMKMYIIAKKAQEEVGELSQKFAAMAVGVFDLCYGDMPAKAYQSLSSRMQVWGNLSILDMASLSHNQKFVAHECCQKWLTKKFMGQIKLRDLHWGFITFPTYIKVILCAFLTFPMYFWVRFKEKAAIHEFVGEDEYETETYIADISESEEIQDRIPGTEETGRSHLLKYHYPPLWEMILLMWSAPVTKFWISIIFYVAYLVIFSVAAIWPSCGLATLDFIVCIWTLLIAFDSGYQLYSVHQSFPNTPCFASIYEIVLLVNFGLFVTLIRVLHAEGFKDPYTGKILVCIGLVYMYYRMIFIYLPISSTMGPLLYRAKEMITVDYVNFLKLVVFILIANAIAMQAILYPDYPLIPELVRMCFHKSFMMFFMTPTTELTQSTPGCVEWVNKPSQPTLCRISDYTEGRCSIGMKFWPYVIVLQYVLLFKLILNTVLFAMFSTTGARIESKMDSIWKYQRYKLIINFSNNLRLPPPLNVFSLLIIIIQFLVSCCRCCMCYIIGRRIKDKTESEEKDEDQNLLSYTDSTYWRELANDYDLKQKKKKKVEEFDKRQLDFLKQLTEGVRQQQNVIHQCMVQLRQLENDVHRSDCHLETLKYRDKKEEDIEMFTVHALSRESPYKRTKIERYPVADKYVLWEVTWLYYDPIFYTMPMEEFSESLQPYVDDDISQKKREESYKLPGKWNFETFEDGKKYINRKSWITNFKGQPVTILLDHYNLPRNPMGRTGLRGKGALPRWGPNHNVFAVITRWQKKKIEDFDDTLNEETDLLDIVQTYPVSGKKKNISLPGGYALTENKYQEIQSCFIMKDDSEAWKSSENMIQFLENYAVDNSEEEPTEKKFNCRQVWCGYMDDPLNTDHAWNEVELWHVHFNVNSTLYRSFEEKTRWSPLSEDFLMKLPSGQTSLVQDAIRPLNANIGTG